MEPIFPSLLVLDIQPTPNTLELKPLLENPKYVYLEDEQRLLVIISTSLTTEQEHRVCKCSRSIRRPLGGHWLTFLVLTHPCACIVYC